MSTTSTGHRAEQAVANYLLGQGYRIVSMNWKTSRCEIDIVAKRHDTIHLVEVKYRRSPDQGSGLLYITPKKLVQMRFAAAMWVACNKWSGPIQLAAAEVTGIDYESVNVIDIE